jgi:hypothetical protein
MAMLIASPSSTTIDCSTVESVLLVSGQIQDLKETGSDEWSDVHIHHLWMDFPSHSIREDGWHSWLENP